MKFLGILVENQLPVLILLKIFNTWWVACLLLFSRFSFCCWLSTVWVQCVKVWFLLSSSYCHFTELLRCRLTFLITFDTFFVIISSNILLPFPPFLSETPIMHMLVCLIVSFRSMRFYSFFLIFLFTRIISSVDLILKLLNFCSVCSHFLLNNISKFSISFIVLFNTRILI